MKILNLIISAFVGLSLLLLQQNKFIFIVNWTKYLITWGKLHPLVIEWAIPIVGAVISYFLCNLVEKIVMKNHFKHSLKVLHVMRKAMQDRVTRNSHDENKEMDRYIQSPIEYAKETLKGNSVPIFKPDDPSQDLIFNSGIKYIVAITAENPNLWMDPTVCFYMANCYAVSLMNQTNKAIREASGKNMKIKRIVVKQRDDLKEKIEIIEKGIIDELCHDSKHLNEFEFIRFFMFTKSQKESCENTVFPSLKAAQDLFRTHSFYINKGIMKERMDDKWGDFGEVVKRLWSLFDETPVDKGGKAVLDKRKKEIIPEFLFLYYDNKIVVQSYLNGVPVKEEVKKSTKYKTKIKRNCHYGDYKIMDDISKLVSSLASYVRDKDYQDDSAFMNNANMVNNNNAFLDWELG